ncbi:MAG: TetR/AcrR family transcriptional regulator [Salinibacterium sp.]|nr:hypothetical protein [Salinibacterium sp.]MBF0673333.1 TetR/AcrR family transcriptional regulator [Salinibacterium sp.]
MPLTDMRNAETIDALVGLFTECGFLSLSVQDMARLSKRSKSTLYGVAASKDGIIEAVVREFFRRATENVEREVAGEGPRERLGSYLSAIAAQLAHVDRRFFDDLGAFGPARRIYLANIRSASERVQQLALAALPEHSRVDPRFVGVVAGLVIESIHRGEVEAATGLTAAEGYAALSELLSAGISHAAHTHTESDRT